MKREFIDITRTIRPGMVVYPGNPSVVFELIAKADLDAQASALTNISLGSHTGTHIDAPSHIDPAGKGTDSYALDSFIGDAQVLDLSALTTEVICAADLRETSAVRVLIKTRNSEGDPDVFDEKFIALDESVAEELVRRGVKLVGIDALSIKKKGVKDRVHEILLSAGVVILEGLWLANVSAGKYELICLPLKLENLDGAPARAVLKTVD